MLGIPVHRAWRRLGSVLHARAISADRREMARSLAIFAGVGGTLMLGAVLLSGGRAPAPAVAVPAAAYGFMALLLVTGERTPLWMIDAVVYVGVGLVTAAVAAGGSLAPSFAMFYIWLALYVFCFFPPAKAALPMLAIAVCCAVVTPPAAVHPAYWLLTVGTSVVAGIWVEHLARRIRDEGRRDALTGLCNRRWFMEEVPRMLALAYRHHHPLSVILLDLDHFKRYNDEHGHQAGDRMLAATARAWLATVREGDVLVRQGGEEFAALLPHCDLDEALTIADRLRGAVPGESTCSAGIAEWNGWEAPDELLARADVALYTAKRTGRNRSVAAGSAPAGPTSDIGRVRWRNAVRAALASHQVDVVYQPIVELTSRTVVAHEALARPTGADAGSSVGGLFDMAARLGHSRDLDWLCRRAALEGGRALPFGPPLIVNVAGTALLDPHYDPDQLLLLLRWCERAPSALVLEISERDAITDLARLGEVIARHRDHGIRFSIDDAGTGGSTLELLAATTPEFIKLGGPLVAATDRAGERAAVIAMRSFALETGARLIAKGVEDEATALRMADLGVELGQGYWLGPPRRLPLLARAVARPMAAPRAAAG